MKKVFVFLLYILKPLFITLYHEKLFVILSISQE
jgi:hypothetical protein